MGDVMVWELGSRERIAPKNFEVWDLGARTMALQVQVQFKHEIFDAFVMMMLAT